MELEGSSQEFSLLFLDIIMDGLTGMETARILLIFLSSSPDFAVESYDVKAVRYLLKPLQENKLKRLLERVLDPTEVSRVCIRSGRQHRYLPLGKIIFAESDNHSIRIHLNGGEVVRSREKLGGLAIRMDDRFLRCTRVFW